MRTGVAAPVPFQVSQGVGFIVTFLRGSEWAAVGKVTQEIPEDFPAADKASSHNFELKT